MDIDIFYPCYLFQLLDQSRCKIIKTYLFQVCLDLNHLIEAVLHAQYAGSFQYNKGFPSHTKILFINYKQQYKNLAYILSIINKSPQKKYIQNSYIFYNYLYIISSIYNRHKIQMSKTIEDYREIVKVLKLQLLKVRQQNNSLSKNLGISSQTQTSSFTPRLNKLKTSRVEFAKHCYLFNMFAHKCQLIGVAPEMVFRIADKKRDKKVHADDLNQVMRRLKLKLDQDQVVRLLKSISKSKQQIGYQDYLQYLNAFQINSQKYPSKGQRTYSQVCLLRFGQEIKNTQKQISANQIYNSVKSKDGANLIKFEDFVDYAKRKTKLKDVQMIGAFVALDTQSDCVIERDVFVRQMNKVLDLVERGVQIDEEYKQIQHIDQPELAPSRISKKKTDQFAMEEETGVEAGVKKKEKKQAKILSGDINKLVKQLRKQGIPPNDFVAKLLQKQSERKLIRPFSLADFQKIVGQINKSISKKKVKQFFKALDSSSNGSVSTDQLVKLWLQGKGSTDSSKTLLKLLQRHFKQSQNPEYFTKFSTSGYGKEDIITINMLENVFYGLNLGTDYIKLIQNNIPAKTTVEQFIQFMKSGGAANTSKKFQPMNQKTYQRLNEKVAKLVSSKDEAKFKKRVRLEVDNRTQSEKQSQYWQTIFTNEWACWKACLDIASKLKTSWRDPEFGPNQGDKHGYRSIVGNESQVPPGLPLEDEIEWMSFEQMLQKQGKMDKVKLFSDNLVANDIVQGKLGDCWFVSSLAIITSNDQFVKGKSDKQCKLDPSNLTYGIHPKMFHMFEKYGIYVFKFFKGFKPIYVMTDQLFPVQTSSNDLIFAKSPDPGLQWVAFLQKAYSKLHHCYSNMISGDIAQGISDLTNTLPIKQDITNSPNPEELLKKIVKLNQQNQLMGCSINAPPKKGTGAAQQPVLLDGQRTGLFSGHAYSLGDLIRIRSKQQEDLRDKKEFNLLRVRNPWGHGEWVLDWSDKPINDDQDYMKLKKYQKDIDQFYQKRIAQAKKMKTSGVDQIVPYKPNDDGQFLMNFYDFAKLFSNLFTGYNLKGNPYICQSFIGKWDKATPSGLCKAKGATEDQSKKFVKDNYQFILQVKEKTDIIMFLIQEDGRLWRGQKYPYKQVNNGIMILSFNLSGNEKVLNKFDKEKMTLPTLKLQLKRQVNYWHKFQPGRYAIIPCKMDNKIKQTQFQFKIYSQNPIRISKANGGFGSQFKQIPQNIKVQSNSAMSSMIDQLVAK